jgi:simple sugar transport system permease protein
MAAFAVAYETGSLTAGFAAGAAVGACVAGIVGLFSIYLGQSQVAVGFVLTLMARDLAYFIGNPYARIQGPRAGVHPLPLLKDLPFLGEVFFSHALPVYFSLLLILFCWAYIYRTPGGLRLRAVGEHPRAAYARGLSPRRLQMIYTFCGGLLVGLAGATFSLATKPGWGRPQGAEGTGWIALALVIFGGWHPVRAAAGAYLFSFLQVMGIYLQGWFPSVPAQVFQVAPFPLMIFTLLLLNLGQRKTPAAKGGMGKLLAVFSGRPPAGLGQPYRPE